MKLQQITVSIENSAGRLLEVTRALADAGINLRALNLVDTGDFGQLRLLVSDVSKARQIMMSKQLSARVDEVVAAEIAASRFRCFEGTADHDEQTAVCASRRGRCRRD